MRKPDFCLCVNKGADQLSVCDRPGQKSRSPVFSCCGSYVRIFNYLNYLRKELEGYHFAVL